MAKSSNTVLLLVIGGVGLIVVLLCGVIGAGIGIYFATRGSSAESQLIGHWEMDPEYLKSIAKNDPMGQLGVNLIAGNTFDFSADHKFKMSMVMALDGKWKVTGRSGQTLNVTLIPQLFGLDADPAYVTITMLDNDHMEFVAPPQKTMTAKGRFRRAGPPR